MPSPRNNYYNHRNHHNHNVNYDYSPLQQNQSRDNLERKLELLEARFTAPLLHTTNTNTTNSNNDTQSNNSDSPATLDPDNSSPATFTSSNKNNNNNNSQHSFGFDTPSLKNSHLTTTTIKPINSSTANPASRSSFTTNINAGWKEVTEAYIMQKVQEQQQQQQQQHQQQIVEEQNANTILTGHPARKSQQQQMVVKETPPSNKSSSSTLFNNTSSNHSGKSNDTTCKSTSATVTVNNSNNKRKSIMPMKRNDHSVKENLSNNNNNETNNKVLHENSTSSKRMKLQFDVTTTNTTSKKSPLSSKRNNNNNNNTMNSSTASNSPMTQYYRSNNSNSRQNNNENSRDAASFKNKKSIISNNKKIDQYFKSTKQQQSSQPSQQQSKVVDDVTKTETDSKKDDNNDKNDNNDNNNYIKNNNGIDINSRNNNSSNKQETTTTTPPPAHAHAQPALTVVTNTLQPRPKIKSPTKPDMQQQYQHLQEKYYDLKRIVIDKDEQLKAITNNRTILQSTLQTALRKREQELENLHNDKKVYERKVHAKLEQLIRTEALQKAKELREQLATDGARLGRIITVPSRNIMRSTMIEHWEDGHATKELQEKKKLLQKKKSKLLQRQKLAKQAEQQFLLRTNNTNELKKDNDNNNDETNAVDEDDDNSNVFGGITNIKTALDAREVIESVRYHLYNINKQEKELIYQEQQLNEEKANHIRAIKRVTSEDASRFKSRPLLHDRYVLQSLLGKGGFSEVWCAYDIIELRQVAVKIHQLDSRWGELKKENYTKHVSREYEIHRNVRHPRIVSLYDVFEIDNNSFATVLEYCTGTDLDTLLKQHQQKNKYYSGCLKECNARSILLQILSGMYYLCYPSPDDNNRQGIIHYDLKPGNILFDEHGDAKITDFGLSKIVDAQDSAESMELTSQGAGTYWYLPPECFLMDETVRISNKVDVWSIGVIFYQMLYGKRPFGDGQSQDRLLADGTMLNAHEVKFPDDNNNNKVHVSDDAKEFIRACLTYDQRLRPSIAKICQHPYILKRTLDDDNNNNNTVKKTSTTEAPTATPSSPPSDNSKS